MRYLSVCSGIEAATVAWHPLGWEPVAFAEIDPAPSAVLAHHYLGVTNLGDFTAIDDADPIDLLVGGTPCQSFSVAGRRLGLDDPRGNLAIEFLRLARRLRPRWLVWENVPGVLSSNGGRDFGAFLGLLGECGYGWAYRVLDAQHFGVPQRRRRVFVVGHLGDWRRACAVLFERESLSGNPPPRREAGAGVAPSVTPGARRASGARSGEQLTVAADVPVAAERSHGHGQFREGLGICTARDSRDGYLSGLIAHTLRADGFDASEDGTGRGTPLVPAAFNWQAGGKQTSLGYDSASGTIGALNASQTPALAGVPYTIQAAFSEGSGPHARHRHAEIAKCLDGHGGNPDCNNGGTVVASGTFQNTGQGWWNEGDVAATIRTPEGSGSKEARFASFDPVGVRRLTPREAERLQGFPDDWTLVPFRGKPMSDGARYRMIGNSMAVNVVRWVGRRIGMVEAIPCS